MHRVKLLLVLVIVLLGMGGAAFAQDGDQPRACLPVVGHPDGCAVTAEPSAPLEAIPAPLQPCEGRILIDPDGTQPDPWLEKIIADYNESPGLYPWLWWYVHEVGLSAACETL
jgi:hypothetical protein